MGKRDEKPTIRILLLGAPGVGKNCLESRFTTQTYPPLYDPALTLTSRRYYTLSSHLHAGAQPDPVPSTRPLETSDTPTGTSTGTSTGTGTFQRRSGSASSTVSNPASEARRPTPPATASAPPKLSLQTSPTTNLATIQHHQDTPPTPLTPASNPSDPPATYLVELTNYPALQNAKTRASVLARRDYDAVILVYDVGNRASFDAVTVLHGEIPLSSSSSSSPSSSSPSRGRRARSHHLFGGGGGGGGSPTEGHGKRGGDTVVALVGNKCDFEIEGEEEGDSDEGEKEAVAVEERSLVHPLFRAAEPDAPLSPRSARSMPVGGGWDAGRNHQGNGQEVRRARSVVSEGGVGQRMSVFSAARPGSLNLVPEEGRDVEPPPGKVGAEVPTAGGAAMEPVAIQMWLEMDSDEPRLPAGYEQAERQRESNKRREREVSRFEGEMLARSLLANVPFLETSARTGENVEELFDAVVREVLYEMGVGVGVLARAAPEETKQRGQTPVLARKRSVLKKQRKVDEKREIVTRESVVSEHPPVLTLPGLDEDIAEPVDDVAADGPIEVAPAEPTPASQKRRRESGLGNFFKKVFTRKSAAMVPHVAA